MELSCSSDYLADAKVIKFSFLKNFFSIIYVIVFAREILWLKRINLF